MIYGTYIKGTIQLVSMVVATPSFALVAKMKCLAKFHNFGSSNESATKFVIFFCMYKIQLIDSIQGATLYSFGSVYDRIVGSEICVVHPVLGQFLEWFM